MRIFGVILAGGRGSRMAGADKAMLPLADAPLIANAIARLAPQVEALAINANGDAGRFAPYRLPVIGDALPGFAGPLAGVLAGLDWAAAKGADAVVSVAVDTPFFPGDLVPRLRLAGELTGQPVVMATSGTGLHPTFALWPVGVRDDLRASLAAGGHKVTDAARALGMAEAAFPGANPDPFLNINTPADLAEAEGYAQRLAGGRP